MATHSIRDKKKVEKGFDTETVFVVFSGPAGICLSKRIKQLMGRCVEGPVDELSEK
jgi:hypothetical protein